MFIAYKAYIRLFIYIKKRAYEMIKSDQHMHSLFSGDSQAEIKDMIDSAIAKNLDTICLTDHYDPLFPCYRPDEGPIFDLDTVKYNEMAVKLRNDEEIQSKINVRVGMELGIYPKVYDLCKEIAAANPYDFIILSSHTAGGKDPYLSIIGRISMYMKE